MIPEYVDQVDADWLSDALSVRRPGTRVEKLEQVSDRPGAGNKLWCRVGYREPTDLPDTFVVKGGFTRRDPDEFTVAWEAMTRGLNAAEARFYRDFAASDAAPHELEIPACYYAGTDDTGRAAVVLEDLTATGVSFGAFDRPLDRDTAALVLEQLALVHAAWWADPVLDGPRLADPLVEGNGLLHYFITGSNWDEQMSRPRGARVPPELRDHGKVVAAVRAMWERQFDGPLCTLHGDPHIGNLYFRTDGRVGLLDWQVFCRGTFATDVAYFIAGALSTGERRAHERDLLRHYLACLAALGVDAPSEADAWDRYRERLFHGFLNLLTPADGIQSEEYNATMGERFATAIVDLDAFEAVRRPR
ncbi:MAG TPA: phosphotransferase [Pseudonocardia sp.]|nr:phosphotransferase [Pseudonocardia sp.]